MSGAREEWKRADALVRAEILSLASEDCSLFCEFVAGLHDFYPSCSEADRIAALRRQFVDLLNQRLVRVHRGDQCSGDRAAAEDLTLSTSELESLPDEAWKGGEQPLLCLCDTELTADAYARAWRDAHGGQG